MKVNPECEISHNKKKFTIKENKCRVNFLNLSGREITEVRIDGCLIKDNNVEKCDYLVQVENKICIFIELKGAKIEKAINQLKYTLKKLNDIYPCTQKICLIVSTRMPQDTKILKYKRELKKEFNAKLLTKNIQKTIDLDVDFKSN